MRRFITISSEDLQEILKVIRNEVIKNMTNDVYQWLKEELRKKEIAHNDQHAAHHDTLPHQGGYTSFYWDENGSTWMYVTH